VYLWPSAVKSPPWMKDVAFFFFGKSQSQAVLRFRDHQGDSLFKALSCVKGIPQFEGKVHAVFSAELGPAPAFGEDSALVRIVVLVERCF